MYYIADPANRRQNIDPKGREYVVFDTAMWEAKKFVRKAAHGVCVVEKEKGSRSVIRGFAIRTDFGSCFSYAVLCRLCRDEMSEGCLRCTGSGYEVIL